MPVSTPGVGQRRADRAHDHGATPVQRSTETKASFKTTEFFAYIAVLAAIFIAGAVTQSGSNANDVFRASQVWLYATILSVGYMVSRGLAKAASREPHSDDR